MRQTASDGSFTLNGIRGLAGDRVTLLASNGADTQVLEVTLSSSAQQDLGQMELDYPADAPRVTINVTFIEEGSKTDIKFVDVSDDAYYANAVDWAVKNGITSGTS